MFKLAKRALAAGSIALATVSMAAAPAAARPPAKAHPGIAGMWMIREAYYLGQPLSPKPELTPAAKAQARLRAEAQAKGYVRSASNMLCGPNGGPQMYGFRSPFEIFEGFGRITFIFETEGNNQPRTIYLNEKVQPPDIYPTFNGHSIGHWEGKTLVVDTIGYNGRGALLGPVQKSDKTHVVERFTWSADGKVMSDQLTMEDPVSLVKPWVTTLVFDRMADTEERFEVWCEVDLDAFKTLDLPSLKDADPEIALMLDPDKRATDPALKIAAPPEIARAERALAGPQDMRILRTAAIGLLALAAPVSAGAHHAFNMFALDKVVTVSGTVKDYQFKMPHVWFYMMLPGASAGAPAEEWGFECHSPNLVARKGWKISTLQPGDKLTVVMHPMKDGSKAGSVIRVVLADGRTLWNAEADDRP